MEGLLEALLGNLSDPVEIVRNANINAGNVHLSTSDSPGNNAGHLPHSISLADEWATSVAFTRIFPFFSTSADEAWIQVIVVSKTGLSELILAGVLVDDGHVDFLQDVLILSEVPVVFSPSSGPATLTREVCKLIGKTGWADVWCS